VTLIHPRGSWGARFADGDANMGQAQAFVVHHTVTANLSPAASLATEAAAVRGVEDIGQARFGFGISYHVLIAPSGRAFQGVSFGRRGTHLGGHNSTTVGVAFLGNFETATPTDAALATAREIRSWGEGRFWHHGVPVRGHRDFSATACPGRHLQARLDDIRRPPGPGGGGFLMALTGDQQAQLFNEVMNLRGFLWAGGPDVDAGNGSPNAVFRRLINLDQQTTGANGFRVSVAERVIDLQAQLAAVNDRLDAILARLDER
jgi:hypothetical protein